MSRHGISRHNVSYNGIHTVGSTEYRPGNILATEMNKESQSSQAA